MSDWHRLHRLVLQEFCGELFSKLLVLQQSLLDCLVTALEKVLELALVQVVDNQFIVNFVVLLLDMIGYVH